MTLSACLAARMRLLVYTERAGLVIFNVLCVCVCVFVFQGGSGWCGGLVFLGFWVRF